LYGHFWAKFKLFFLTIGLKVIKPKFLLNTIIGSLIIWNRFIPIKNVPPFLKGFKDQINFGHY